MARNIVLDLLATLYGISRITARQWKGCPQGQTFFIRPAAPRGASVERSLITAAKVTSCGMRLGPRRAILREEVRAMAIIPEKYLDLLQRKKAFANLATLMPDGSPQVTPVWCDYKDGLVRVNKYREGTSESAQPEERRARGACDRRSRQSVPLRPDPWPRPARHRRRRGCAHRFARKEISREGQVSECRARRSPADVRDRADIGIRDGMNS